MSFYNRTNAAESILKEGFRDNNGLVGALHLGIEGVFLSNVPLDCNEGAKGNQQLEVTFSADYGLSHWELVEESGEQHYREWCLPACLINGNATVRLMTEEEEDEFYR